MAVKKLADRKLKDLPRPEPGASALIVYDTEVSGLGCRTTAAGVQSFTLEYRTRSGRKRRFTIGRAGEWSVGAARAEAKELKRKIAVGKDPMGEVHTERGAQTVADLCERFIKEHLPRKRPKTQVDYKAEIETYIKPAMGSLKVSEVEFSDCDHLHRKITKRGAPYRANRVLSVVSKMFALSIKWRMRTDNPARGVEKNPEEKRERYLDADELKRLATALTSHHDQQAANILRLLALTGARRGEVQSVKWADLDLTQGIWSKPSASTKQKKPHRVPLSAPARQLLAELRKSATENAEYVFPGRRGAAYRTELKDNWKAICKSANLVNARMHDLRHSVASFLVSSGHSLALIGRMLGHTNPNTTSRYAHLFDDPLKAAAESVGAFVTGQPSGEIVPLSRRRK